MPDLLHASPAAFVARRMFAPAERAVAQPAPPTPTMRPIAYLTNVYPSVSHSFIRREILALEAQGFEIARFAVRRAKGPLPDPDDQAERGRTTILLEGGYAALALAVVRTAIARPARLLTALRMTIAMGRAAASGPIRPLAYLAEACALSQVARARGIRHVHVHFGTNPAAVARLAKALGGPTYSMTIHGPDEFDAPAALSLADKVHDAAFVVGISDHGRAQIMRWSRRSDWERIKRIRCGIDRRFLGPMNDDSSAMSSRFVCVARLDPQKGLPLLLDAVAMLDDIANFELRIVGDGAMRGELESRIAELGLRHRVTLLGWRSADAIRRELLGARALVLASFAEGLPIVLMEALALGRPVIATAVAGRPELVDAGCGWLVPAGSVEHLAAALRAAAAADHQTARALGQEGQARVRARHDGTDSAAALGRWLAKHA